MRTAACWPYSVASNVSLGAVVQTPLMQIPQMQTLPDADVTDADPWMQTPYPLDVEPPSPRMQTPLPVNRMTHTFKNITLPQTLFVDGKNKVKQFPFNFIM